MDKCVILPQHKDLDVTDAISCVLAIYYVFGVEYPKGLKNTLLFLEKYMFGLGSVKTPVPVLRMHSILTS